MQQAAVQQLPTDPAQIFAVSLDRICTSALTELYTVVDAFRGEQIVPYQFALVEACIKRIIGQDLRLEQTRVLRRLIYGNSDTLLVARTGWGKSVILHLYSILTSLITIQIIPLSKLGEEQMQSIKLYPSTRPCLLTEDTRRREQRVLEKIRLGKYTHVLLGPEQASSPAFRKMLQDPSVQKMIGLVAIDECHTIRAWRDFRHAFNRLGELRVVLGQSVVWFGCSATVDEETERSLLLGSGFREVGTAPYQTQVIRTTIDRPDIAICFHPIPRKQLGNFSSLYFLLNDAIDKAKTQATPARIPKTIVFVDGHSLVSRVATVFRHVLLQLTCAVDGARYVASPASSAYCVGTVVQTFTSTTATADKESRYKEYRSPSSKTRIMVATTSLGMGVNVPDILRVVQWRFPIDKQISDLWQRLGRCSRTPGMQGVGHVFLPYWVFDSEGRNKTTPAEPQSLTQASSNRTRSGSATVMRRSQSVHKASQLNISQVIKSSTESENESCSNYSSCSDEDRI